MTEDELFAAYGVGGAQIAQVDVMVDLLPSSGAIPGSDPEVGWTPDTADRVAFDFAIVRERRRERRCQRGARS